MLKSNKGSALLSALFIMTLVAIATTTLTLQLKNSLNETRLLFNTNQFQQDSIVVRYWAMDFLASKKHKHFGHKPSQTQHIEKHITFPSLPEYHFSAELIDLNARFNLNNLKYPSGKTTFYRLTKHLLEDASDKKSYPITSALSNWITEYQPGHTQHDTQLIAHLPIVSLSELSLVPNIKLKDLQVLMPYLTALPAMRKTPININTASEDLLMAMANGQDAVKHMEALFEARGEDGIESMNDIRDTLRKLAIQEEDVTLESDYFLSIGHIKTKTLKRTLYSLLQRVKNKDGSYSVHLIHETWNTD
ncbi:MAG: type II secretion system minor pseudopilin GspK [Legionellaceae bacterium]|nr:type II secretion system minor pseudopilin GspK [Legionellaceae bacterium]